VAIPGAGGGLGHLAIQIAKSMRFRVLAIGRGAEKEALAKSLGADAWVDYIKIPGDKEIQEVKRITGGGAHAFLVLSDHEIPYRNAEKMVRTGGTIMCVARPKNTRFAIDVEDVITRSLTVRGTGSHSYDPISQRCNRCRVSRSDAQQVLKLLENHTIKLSYTIFGLSELQRVFELMERGETVGRYVLDTSR